MVASDPRSQGTGAISAQTPLKKYEPPTAVRQRLANEIRCPRSRSAPVRLSHAQSS
jgi:hypothetical protein